MKMMPILIVFVLFLVTSTALSTSPSFTSHALSSSASSTSSSSSSSSSPTLPQSSTCKNIVPGLAEQQRGIDITTFDILGKNPNWSPAPLIQYTCFQERTIIAGGQTYDLPDQVLGNPIDLPYTQTEYVDVLDKTFHEYAMTMSQTVGTSHMFGMFSSSQTYRQTLNYINGQSRMAGLIFSQVSANEIHFVPVDPDLPSTLQLDSQVCGPYAQILETTYPEFNESTVTKYEKFIANCGTHYLSVASYGGWLISAYYTQRDLLLKMNEHSIEGQAEASFMNFLSSTGGASQSQKTIDAQYTAATFSITTTRGGVGSPSGSNTFSGWQASVPTNPWIWKAIIQPVSLLVSTKLQPSLNLSIENHLSVAFLRDEVLPSCDLWLVTLTPYTQIPQCTYSGDCGAGRTGYNICESEWRVENRSAVAQPWQCCHRGSYPAVQCCCSQTVNAAQYNKISTNSKYLIQQVLQMKDNSHIQLSKPIVDQPTVQLIGQQYQNISRIMQTQTTQVTCSRTLLVPQNLFCPHLPHTQTSVILAVQNVLQGIVDF